MDKIKDFFKKNGKMVAIVLLSLMFISKCTTSCNRGTTIKHQTVQIEQLDSIITARDSAIYDMMMTNEQLKNSLTTEKEHNSNFTLIATGNQSDLVKKMNDTQKENASLKRQVKELQKKVDELTPKE